MSKSNKRILLVSLSSLIILLSVLVVSYFTLTPQSNPDKKDISVSVVTIDDNNQNFDISTYEAYLGDALRDNGIIPNKTDNSPTFVTTVCGITADTSKQEWWNISKNGEFLSTGVDDTVLSDGDSYDIVLSCGY